MTTPTIAERLKTIENALKWLHVFTATQPIAEDAMVALQYVRTELQPSDAGVAVAVAEDDEAEHDSGVATWPIMDDLGRVTEP